MFTTDALVLSHTNYRDYDRMLTLYSPTLGRLDAVARGCQRPKSPLMNATERFCAGEFSLVEARGRLTLRDCRIKESFYPLRQDVDRLTAGAYLLHLLLQCAQPEEANRPLFLTSLKALAYFAYGGLPLSMAVMGYELHYLALTGQAPRMNACCVCGRPFVQQPGLFSVHLGGVLCPGCGVGEPLSHGARRILMRVPMTPFTALEKLPGHPDWPEAARHARSFVAYRLDSPPRLWPGIEEGSRLG